MATITNLRGPAALRRSTRLTISVPITISGLDAEGKPFIERTHTVGVNKHGGKIRTRHEVKLREPIQVENPKLNLTVKAVVAWIGERRVVGEPYEIGIALSEPQNIWGIEFPPDDWNEAPPPAGERPGAWEAVIAVPAQEPKPPEPPAPANLIVEKAKAPAGPAPAFAAPNAPAASGGDTPALTAQLTEQMKLLAEAHSRLFQKEFAELAYDIREALRRELQQLTEDSVQEATHRIRRELQKDLEQFACQLTEMKQQLTDDCVRDLRQRVVALLAALDTPPSRGSH